MSESAGVLIVCAAGGGLTVLYVAIDWAGKRFQQWAAQRAADREAAYLAWRERVGGPPSEHLEHAVSLRDRIAAARERRAEPTQTTSRRRPSRRTAGCASTTPDGDPQPSSSKSAPTTN